MKLNPGSRVKPTLTVTSTFDPRGSVVELRVDDTWHPATWIGAPSVNGDKWTQSAVTSEWYAGTTAATTGDVTLTAGRHATLGRLTNGGQVVVFATEPIDVG